MSPSLNPPLHAKIRTQRANDDEDDDLGVQLKRNPTFFKKRSKRFFQVTKHF